MTDDETDGDSHNDEDDDTYDGPPAVTTGRVVGGSRDDDDVDGRWSPERGIEMVGTVAPPVPSEDEEDPEDNKREVTSTPPRSTHTPAMSERDGYPQFVPSLSASHLSEDGQPVPSSPANNSILAEDSPQRLRHPEEESNNSSSSSSYYESSSGSSDISLLIEEEVLVDPRRRHRLFTFPRVHRRDTDDNSDNDQDERRPITMRERCYTWRLIMWNAAAGLLMFVCWTVPILIVMVIALGICILPTVCLLVCACCFFIGDRDAFAALWATLMADDMPPNGNNTDSRPSPPPRKTRQELQDDMLRISKVVEDGKDDDKTDIEAGELDADTKGKSDDQDTQQRQETMGTIEIADLPQNSCDICLLEYKAGDAVASPLHCDECPHMFHKDCLLDWLQQEKTTCPCCRREYSKDVTLSEAEALQSLTLLRSIYLRSQQQSGGSGDLLAGLPDPSHDDNGEDDHGDDDVLVIPPVVLGGDRQYNRLPRTRGINYFQMSLDSLVEEEEAQVHAEAEVVESLDSGAEDAQVHVEGDAQEDLEAGDGDFSGDDASESIPSLEDVAVSGDDSVEDVENWT